MILVTGATGFIGSHLVEKLLSRAEKVRVLVRPVSSRRVLPAVDIVCADLPRGDGLGEALAGVETVIHLAGATKSLRAEDYYTANVKATESLARAIAGRGIRLVHVSSLAAIGPSLDGKPIGEDAEPHPITTYGKSKLEAERVVRALVPDAVIIRPPVVYGPRDTGVFEVLKPISKGWALEIAGGERRFSAIYVRDLVEGLIAALQCPAARGRAYFLSHPAPASWRDLTSTAGRIMGRQPRTVRVPVGVAMGVGLCAEVWSHLTGRPGIVSREKVMEARCAAWVCDSRRAAEELGFEAQTALEKGLAETLSWYKEARWLRY